ncbi:hypothetical protein [Litorivicinus lipolyticus]|uniref:hypothetical protein n=1 Tax=Litorivicinus lipolyticus TaxID=418701 RepID=UPI003B5BAEA4
MSPTVLVLGDPVLDAMAKWAVWVAVMLTVWVVWLGFGVSLKHAGLLSPNQIWINRALAVMMVVALIA